MNTYTSPYTSAADTTISENLYSRVAVLLTFSCLATAAGAYVGRDLSGGGVLVAIIAFFASYLVLFLVRFVEPLNVIVLYIFTFIAGLTIGPVIAQYTGVPGGARVLVEAMVLSALIFAGAGAFGWMTSTNLAPLARYLFGALLALIAVGLVLAFIATSRAAEVVYDIGIAVVFTAYTALDLQRVRRSYGPSDYIIATVSIYIDALNLFLAVLDLLGGDQRT